MNDDDIIKIPKLQFDRLLNCCFMLNDCGSKLDECECFRMMEESEDKKHEAYLSL